MSLCRDVSAGTGTIAATGTTQLAAATTYDFYLGQASLQALYLATGSTRPTLFHAIPYLARSKLDETTRCPEAEILDSRAAQICVLR